MPDLDDIALVVAAADRASFGAVARDMHVSQSTVSRAVQRIETAIGTQLFIREGRSVRLHPEAAPSVERLRSLLNDWQTLTIAARTEERKSLSVYCTVTASQLIAPNLFEHFRRARPDVYVDLRTGSASGALNAVLNGEVDVAIAPLPHRLPKGLVSVALLTTPFVAVAPREVRSLEGQVILLSRQGLLRELSEKWVRKALGPVIVREAETNEEVLALAAMGTGVAIVPKLVVDASSLGQRVRFLTTPTPLPTITVGLTAKRGALTRDPIADLWANA